MSSFEAAVAPFMFSEAILTARICDAIEVVGGFINYYFARTLCI
jgi:hypothetical protein